MHRVADLPGDGGQQAALARNRRSAGIDKQKSAGAVGAFPLAAVEAGLAEQGRLLVAGHAGNRDAVRQKIEAVGLGIDFR